MNQRSTPDWAILDVDDSVVDRFVSGIEALNALPTYPEGFVIGIVPDPTAQTDKTPDHDADAEAREILGPDYPVKIANALKEQANQAIRRGGSIVPVNAVDLLWLIDGYEQSRLSDSE